MRQYPYCSVPVSWEHQCLVNHLNSLRILPFEVLMQRLTVHSVLPGIFSSLNAVCTGCGDLLSRSLCVKEETIEQYYFSMVLLHFLIGGCCSTSEVLTAHDRNQNPGICLKARSGIENPVSLHPAPLNKKHSGLFLFVLRFWCLPRWFFLGVETHFTRTDTTTYPTSQKEQTKATTKLNCIANSVTDVAGQCQMLPFGFGWILLWL